MEDKEQKRAILHDSGPALILAGPGSGKTYVITHHIEHLIETGALPESILVITFTRAAANEMKSRFKKLLPYAANRIVFGTFHSVFYRLLKIFKADTPDIISTQKRKQILLDILKDPDLSEELGNKISYYKSLLDKSFMRFLNKRDEDNFFDVYYQYQSILSLQGLIDFDDILILFDEMIKSDKYVLLSIQNQFKYLCIDEFQDINSIQYDAVKNMFSPAGNVFSVGDDDQSIYGFRGASSILMQKYLGDFNDVTVIKLEHNYRSGIKIVEAADNVIRDNTGRLRQTIQQVGGDRKGLFSIFFFESREKELKALKDDCYKTIQNGLSCAILFRTNKDVQEMKEFLFNKPCSSRETIKAEIVEDILHYIRGIRDNDLASLKHIINKPNRYIPLGLIDSTQGNLDLACKRCAGTYRADVLFTLNKQLGVMKKLNLYSMIMYIKNICGHEKYIIEKYPEADKKEICGIYEEILEYVLLKGISVNAAEDLNLIIKSSKEIYNCIESENVYISTYHQSKGLEFDVVFLPDVIEGKVPSLISVEECKVEEERRLFYVAMTRAKNELYIYTIKNEESGGSLPSRFLKKLNY